PPRRRRPLPRGSERRPPRRFDRGSCPCRPASDPSRSPSIRLTVRMMNVILLVDDARHPEARAARLRSAAGFILLGRIVMPMIDVYAAADMFPAGSDRQLGDELTHAVLRAEGVATPGPFHLNNTAAYIHRLDASAVQTAA